MKSVNNNNLFASLEQKTDEVASLREALAERDALLDKLNQEKRNLERSLSLMGEAKAKSEASNQRLDNDLTSLRKVCDTQERNIEIFKSEKKNLLDKLDQANYDIDTLKAKVRSVTETSNNNGKMLDEANKTIMKLDSDLTETEQNLNRAKNEINSLNSALMKEKRMHEEFEQKSERLEGTVKERLNDIKRLNNDNEELHNLIDKLTIEKNICLSDIDKYKAHIMFLTESNQKLTNELEGVVDRDEKIRAQLQRGERIGSLLAQNRNDIENLLQAIDFFVFPSVFEGLPVVLIEAQVAGLPIFASSTISKAVKITSNFEFISLAESSETWANRILEKEKLLRQRKNTTNEISVNGYDIVTECKKIENYLKR